MGGITEIRVRYQETDQMGLAYHGNYPTWMEVGRAEFFRELGMPYKVFEEKGVMLPLVEMGCRFRNPIRYDDLVTIETKVSFLSPVKITFAYNLATDKLAAEGFTTHAFVNAQGKPINTAKKNPEIWAWLESHFSSSDS
jgi:acyl-CoA thioester hydrolase